MTSPKTSSSILAKKVVGWGPFMDSGTEQHQGITLMLFRRLRDSSSITLFASLAWSAWSLVIATSAVLRSASRASPSLFRDSSLSVCSSTVAKTQLSLISRTERVCLKSSEIAFRWDSSKLVRDAMVISVFGSLCNPLLFGMVFLREFGSFTCRIRLNEDRL